jgi:hypothetical protein
MTDGCCARIFLALRVFYDGMTTGVIANKSGAFLYLVPVLRETNWPYIVTVVCPSSVRHLSVTRLPHIFPALAYLHFDDLDDSIV